ncbi:MAG: acyl-CoA dehydrogenase family protein [Burkholderiales bacterium]
MDDTLRLLADAAANFAKPDAARIRADRSLPGGFDRTIWSAIAGQGWLSILVPESAGGLGLGIDAAAVVAERLGYAGYREPYVAAGVLASACIAACDHRVVRERYLPRMLDGSLIPTVAWQSEDGALAMDSPGVMETAVATGRTLNGNARFVPIPSADIFIVAARSPTGVSLYCVERSASGLSIRDEPLADGTAQGWLTFEAVRVSDADQLATTEPARDALHSALGTALVVSCAELVGLMERVIEITLEYLRTRQQFGKAIGSFQVLQHRAVDLWIQKELSRAAITSAMHVFMDPLAPLAKRSAAASSAKVRASQAAMLVCTQAIQMHGAIGFTDEYELGLYVNRALVLSAWLGNATDHRRRYAQLDAGSFA